WSISKPTRVIDEMFARERIEAPGVTKRMAFFPGRSHVERTRSAGKITFSHPKKEFRHAIDNPIWHIPNWRIVRPDSHRGWAPGHACGTGAATISRRAIG